MPPLPTPLCLTTCLFSSKSVSKDVIRRNVQNIPPSGYNVIRNAPQYDVKDEPAARHLMGIANCSSHPNGLSEHPFETLLVRRFLFEKVDLNANIDTVWKKASVNCGSAFGNRWTLWS